MSEAKTKAFGIRLSTELLERIDESRGERPRSTWIADLIRKALTPENCHDKN